MTWRGIRDAAKIAGVGAVLAFWGAATGGPNVTGLFLRLVLMLNVCGALAYQFMESKHPSAVSAFIYGSVAVAVCRSVWRDRA